MFDPEMYSQWLIDELSHQEKKFSHSQQVAQITETPLTSNLNFGGIAANYWHRAQILGDSTDSDFSELLIRKTQLIGKIAPTLTAFWRTLRTHNLDDYNGSDILPILDIAARANLDGPGFTKSGRAELKKVNFYDTSVGQEIGWYSQKLETEGIPTTNLGLVFELGRSRNL